MTEPLVYVVVLNWRGWQDTIECLESLRAVRYSNLRVVVVDNGSGDESVPRLRAWLSKHGGELIECGENLGYARGNNAGIRHALERGARYVVILNNDVTVDAGFLRPLVDAARSDVGIVGARVLDPASRRVQHPCMARRPGFFGILILYSGLQRLFRGTRAYSRYLYSGESTAEVYAAAGSAMLLCGDALRTVGFFDEETFLFWEEAILSEKMRRSGYRTLCAPASIVYHKGGRSTAKISPAERDLASMRGEQRYLRYLDLMPAQRSLLGFVRFLSFTVRALFRNDYRARYAEFLNVLRGY